VRGPWRVCAAAAVRVWAAAARNNSIPVSARVFGCCQEIDAYLQMEDPPRRLKDLNMKIGTDGGGEMTSPRRHKPFPRERRH
jgi:hypothetical protein